MVSHGAANGMMGPEALQLDTQRRKFKMYSANFRVMARPRGLKYVFFLLCFVGLACPVFCGDVQASERRGVVQRESSLDYEWEQIQSLLNNRAFHDALDRLVAFRGMVDRAGQGSMEMHSRAILARVKSLDPATGAQYGAKLVDAAEGLTPRLAATRSEKLRGTVRHGEFEWSQLPIDVIDTVRWSTERVGDRLALFAFLSAVVALATLVAIFLALVALLFRLAPIFYHVVSHYPGFALPKQVYAVLIASGVWVLASEGFGLIGAALLVAAPCCLVAQASLRRLVYLVAVLSLILVSVGSYQVDHQLFYQGNLQDIIRCQEGPCHAEIDKISKAAIGESPLKGYAAFVRGLHWVRQLRGAEAEAEFVLAEESGFRGTVLDTARGNALLLSLAQWCPERPNQEALKEVTQKAASFYESALTRSPSAVAPLYNLALTYVLMGDDDSAERFFSAFLMRADGVVPPTRRRVSELKPFSPCLPLPGPVGLLAWEKPSDASVEDALTRLRASGENAPWFPFQELFLGTNPPDFLVTLLFSLAALVFASGRWAGKSPMSRQCNQCHRVFCRFCGETGTHTDSCPECIMDQLKISPLDPKTVWLQQNERQSAAQRSARWTLLVSVLIPGIGHLFAGSPLRGFLVVWGWCVAVALLGGPLGYLWGWSPRAGFSEFIGSLVPLLALLAIYLYGIAGAMENRDGRGA